jgi:tRNA threonylcarbamoyladenosine biosynthesis protein TsaE
MRSTPVDSVTVSTNGAEGTAAVAALLAPHLRIRDVVLLKGGLATGKTTFVKAVASALGSRTPVTSPTFTLAHFYPFDQGTILHVDTYRLSTIHEYRDLGLEEYLDEVITLVEWGDKVADEFPDHLMVDFHCDSSAPELRVITFSSDSLRWLPVIDAIQAALLNEVKFG